VTSPSPGEGKTTTVANLGFGLHSRNEGCSSWTAICDAPPSTGSWALNSPRAQRVLTGHATMQQAVHKNIVPGLDVLCAGELPVRDPEILGSKHMVNFLKDLNSTMNGS